MKTDELDKVILFSNNCTEESNSNSVQSVLYTVPPHDHFSSSLQHFYVIPEGRRECPPQAAESSS